MLNKGYPRLRTTLRKSLGPVSSPLSRALKTSETIAQNPRHVLKLLLNSRLAPATQSQPDVFPFAAFLGERFGCTHVIAIGQPSAKDLIQIYPKFEFVGVVPSLEVEPCRRQYAFGTWLNANTSLAATLPVPAEVLQRSVIVSKDMDQFADPESLLKTLKVWLEQAPVCILTSTDRDLTGAGPPGKWNSKEFEDLLRAAGFNLEFSGWTANDNVNYEKKTIVVVITSD